MCVGRILGFLLEADYIPHVNRAMSQILSTKRKIGH
jgi:hypothetical protein